MIPMDEREEGWEDAMWGWKPGSASGCRSCSAASAPKIMERLPVEAKRVIDLRSRSAAVKARTTSSLPMLAFLETVPYTACFAYQST